MKLLNVAGPQVLALIFAMILSSEVAQAMPNKGHYRLSDGHLYYYDGGDHACRWESLEFFHRFCDRHYYSKDLANASIAEFEGVTLDGYCDGGSGPKLPTKIIDNKIPEGAFCRHFVATDKLTPKVYDGEFSNLTFWIMDENQIRGPKDLINWTDTFRVGRGYKNHDKHVRRSVPLVSNWFELRPKGESAPLFSFYGFTRWKSYLFSEFKFIKINPLNFGDWKETTEILNFKGQQRLSTRVAQDGEYMLNFRVLRLCSKNLDELHPDVDLVIPDRVQPPAQKQK